MLRDKLIDYWNNDICERTNRIANKSVIKASQLWHSGNRFKMFLAMLIHARNIKRFGCEVYPQANIGKNLYMPHCTGIVIGSTTELGDNCIVFPNVVFGARYSPKEANPLGRRHPKVGDNCVFGANSSIIGAITIGNNVTVGAGAVVTKDVPDNVTVVGFNEVYDGSKKV